MNVVVVGLDLDLLVLMCQLNGENSNTFIYKVGISTVKTTFLIRSALNVFETLLCLYIPTTSAFAGKGKRQQLTYSIETLLY